VPKRLTSEGRSFRVVSDGTYGEIETAIPERHTYSLKVPPDAGRRFSWLELRAESPFAVNTLGVTDVRGEWIRTISFKTLDHRRRSLRVQVGACSQWHGFRGSRLYLESAADQRFSAIRLVP
jgi:hypothetical protein